MDISGLKEWNRCGTSRRESFRIAAAIGVFDGVHLGHRAILAETVRIAAAIGATPVAVTFDPHPRAVLRPEEPPTLLVPLEERLRLLREAGAAEVRVIDFTPEFARLAPEEFLMRLPGADILGAICVGENWRFGKGGAGNREFLQRYCRENSIVFSASKLVTVDGETVSSTGIRRAIAAGKLALAAAMLGRNYALFGKVEYGYHAATEKLDCPTANLAVEGGVLPPDGVYAAAVRLENRLYPAAVNIGFAPTFGWSEHKRRVEVHMLDFTGKIYGAPMSVELLSHLREERMFAGPEELKEQIGRDIATIRDYFLKRENQR